MGGDRTAGREGAQVLRTRGWVQPAGGRRCRRLAPGPRSPAPVPCVLRPCAATRIPPRSRRAGRSTPASRAGDARAKPPMGPAAPVPKGPEGLNSWIPLCPPRVSSFLSGGTGRPASPARGQRGCHWAWERPAVLPGNQVRPLPASVSEEVRRASPVIQVYKGLHGHLAPAVTLLISK